MPEDAATSGGGHELDMSATSIGIFPAVWENGSQVLGRNGFGYLPDVGQDGGQYPGFAFERVSLQMYGRMTGRRKMWK